MKYIFWCCIAIGLFTVCNNNSKQISAEEKDCLNSIINDISQRNNTFASEVNTIRQVQHIVQHKLAGYHPMPLDITRTACLILEQQSASCFDNCYIIESCLQVLGFETRHVYLYADIPYQIDIIKSQLASHAITEVKTSKSWMIVDPTIPFIGLDSFGNCFSMKDLVLYRSWNKQIGIMDSLPATFKNIYQSYSPLYGVYSRHGKFKAPYNSIPDYNIRELCYNF